MEVDEKYITLVAESWDEVIAFARYICPPEIRITNADIVKKDYRVKTVNDAFGRPFTSSKSESLRLNFRFKRATFTTHENMQLTRTYDPNTKQWTPYPAFAAVMGTMNNYIYRVLGNTWPEVKPDPKLEDIVTTIELACPSANPEVNLECRVWRGYPDPANNQVNSLSPLPSLLPPLPPAFLKLSSLISIYRRKYSI